MATAFLGPTGGAVTAVLSNLLLGKTNASPEEINNALQTLTPEIAHKIKELEFNYKLEELRMQNQDMANAREREVLLATAGAPDHSINTITYASNTGKLINGVGVCTISFNWGSVTLYYDGTAWFTI